MSIFTTSQAVADEVAARLARISRANGFETDIGLRLFKGRKAIDDAQIPCCVLIEGTDTATDRPGRLPSVSIRQRYMAAAYVTCDPNNPNLAAHAAVRDVKRAIFAGDASFGGKVLRVAYAGRDIGVRADGSPTVYVSVEIDVDFVEDLSNP